jgi:2-polyprenyl-3-methyl-5-hydroxy-6-metoxy-1,4-benzoquinol methylase
MNVKEHYEEHLYEYYSWIYGGLLAKLEENREFFKENNIKPQSTGIALDLGAGSGFQSIPLAEAGFRVKAIDICGKLLEELNQAKYNLDIETTEDDILNFSVYSKSEPELIVCMGDTLTHLNSFEDVKKLVRNSYNLLKENGKLIITYRDLTNELKDDKRFIPVRSDRNRIFTCFLEYFKDYVDVYDIVNENINGEWKQKVSCYKKIKISEEQIKNISRQAGFEIESIENNKGLLELICIKP